MWIQIIIYVLKLCNLDTWGDNLCTQLPVEYFQSTLPLILKNWSTEWEKFPFLQSKTSNHTILHKIRMNKNGWRQTPVGEKNQMNTALGAIHDKIKGQFEKRSKCQTP